MTWIENINESVVNYLDDLKKDKSLFEFNPVKKSLIEDTQKYHLGSVFNDLKLTPNFNIVNNIVEFENFTDWARINNSYLIPKFLLLHIDNFYELF